MLLAQRMRLLKEDLWDYVSTDVGGEMKAAKLEALKARPAPFGFKKATAAEWRNEITGNKRFREDQLKNLGVDKFFERWGGGKNG